MNPLSNKHFSIVTSLYNEKNTERIGEFIYCLEMNLSNEFISAVHIFYDTSKDDDDNILFNRLTNLKNVSITRIDKRPSFRELFEYSNKHLSFRNIIICNADIYFNNTLALLINITITKIFFVLTRWDVQENGDLKLLSDSVTKLPNYLSADVWIYQSPLAVDFYCDYELGTYYCDSFLNTQLFNSNRKIFNPCLDIQACHLQRAPSVSQLLETNEMKELKVKMYVEEHKRNNLENPISGVIWSGIDRINLIRDNQYIWAWENIIFEVSGFKPSDYQFLIPLIEKLYTKPGYNFWIIDKTGDKHNINFVHDLNLPYLNFIREYEFTDRTVLFGEDYKLSDLKHSRRDLFISKEAINIFATMNT